MPVKREEGPKSPSRLFRPPIIEPHPGNRVFSTAAPPQKTDLIQFGSITATIIVKEKWESNGRASSFATHSLPVERKQGSLSFFLVAVPVEEPGHHPFLLRALIRNEKR